MHAFATLPITAARGPKLKSVTFPSGFLWGAATAGHQIEGNNTNSDFWLMENVKPTIFSEPSRDACNSFERWRDDLELVRSIGLNSYRFSIEWARIEPEPGEYSLAMLDHYKRIIHTCRDSGIAAVVTFSHWTVPTWFAARGGWTKTDSPSLFARYCDRAARHLGAEMAYAVTLNEPNGLVIANRMVPQGAKDILEATMAAARKTTGSPDFVGGPAFQYAPAAQPQLLKAHRLGFDAIKSTQTALPVGFSLAFVDEQAAEGGERRRDDANAEFYGPWLETAKADDFMGVQNYTRRVWGADGVLPAPTGATLNQEGSEVLPVTVSNAVRYAHRMTGRPIMITEHGVATRDDQLRSDTIVAAIAQLTEVVSEGTPLLGYLHWSLIDNFEWVSGYRVTYGLASVDRTTFNRTAKPSAIVYGRIARQHRIQ